MKRRGGSRKKREGSSQKMKNDVRKRGESRPNIHRVDGGTIFLLPLAVEYSHRIKCLWRLSGQDCYRRNLWDGVPTDPVARLRFNAERLVGSAIVQAYNVTTEEGHVMLFGKRARLPSLPYDGLTTSITSLL